MAVFKCKMCGAALEVTGKESVVSCDYCGSTQTLPRLENDRKANLYDRANHFRRSNEFDKAIDIYEQILNEDAKDAEAYWSLVLCKYGIEYVEDPVSKRRVPTVHRAQFTSIFADENYKAALSHADADQKAIYEAEAKQIDEIQKGILAISQKEKPFDVFICYKETDEKGERTVDSVLATDIYDRLTKEGFKVFFSRITLEGKLGTAYEPYIFAALHSAKVMVVVGAKKEYFEAVWVRNEWSRFLSLMKHDSNKYLIPAYKDITAYDLPREFSHLQAQDMSKLGCMQDLIHGIRKFFPKEEPKIVTKGTTVVNNGISTNTQSLLKRAFLFLEDGDWRSANTYCDKVLDIEPENAHAYLGKLMAELHVSHQKNLADEARPFDQNNHYKKVLRFAEEPLAATLRQYNTQITERNELNRLTAIYTDAKQKMASANTEQAYRSAAETFRSISGFRDAAAMAEDCEEKAKDTIYQRAVAAMNADDEQKVKRAREEFQSISGYRNADDLAEQCVEKAEIARKNHIYNLGVSFMTIGARDVSVGEAKYNEAAVKFQSISGYKDADALAQECLKNAEESRKEKLYYEAIAFEDHLPENEKDRIAAYKKAIKRLEKIPGYKDAEEKIAEYRGNVSKQKALKAVKTTGRVTGLVLYKLRYVLLIAVAAVLLWVGIQALITKVIPEFRYNRAVSLLENGEYAEALERFEKLGDYKDSAEKIGEVYGIATDCMKRGEEIEAYDIFMILGNYKDAHEQCVQIMSLRIHHADSIVATEGRSFAIRRSGTVLAAGSSPEGQCDVSSWTDIVAIAACDTHTVGLKADGTVVATGESSAYASGAPDLSEWTGIVKIAVVDHCTVGLRLDGTLLFAGQGDIADRKAASQWTDIQDISLGSSSFDGYFVAALKTDGTVVSSLDMKPAADAPDVADWMDIAQLVAGSDYIAALQADGTIIAAVSSSYFAHGTPFRRLPRYSDIVAISAKGPDLIGMDSKGTVVSSEGSTAAESKWKKARVIASSATDSYALLSDGTVITTGDIDLSGWKDIVAIAVGPDHILGLQSDGTVIAAGDNSEKQCILFAWDSIRMPEIPATTPEIPEDDDSNEDPDDENEELESEDE